MNKGSEPPAAAALEFLIYLNFVRVTSRLGKADASIALRSLLRYFSALFSM